MDKIVSTATKANLAKSNPQWNYWSFRRVVRIYDKEKAWYKEGQIIKIKWFGTFGCFDYKDRWVDYYDVGIELNPIWWYRFIFWIKNIFK